MQVNNILFNCQTYSDRDRRVYNYCREPVEVVAQMQCSLTDWGVLSPFPADTIKPLLRWGQANVVFFLTISSSSPLAVSDRRRWTGTWLPSCWRAEVASRHWSWWCCCCSSACLFRRLIPNYIVAQSNPKGDEYAIPFCFHRDDDSLIRSLVYDSFAFPSMEFHQQSLNTLPALAQNRSVGNWCHRTAFVYANHCTQPRDMGFCFRTTTTTLILILGLDIRQDPDPKPCPLFPRHVQEDVIMNTSTAYASDVECVIANGKGVNETSSR